MKQDIKLKRNLNISLIFVLLIVLLCAAGFFFTPHDPYKTNLGNALSKPCAEYPCGTDHLGRCVLSRIIKGASVSVFSAMAVVLTVSVLGTVIGIISGFTGGFTDNVFMKITMIFQAFPYFLLAVCVAGILGSGMMNGMISLIAVYWTTYARLGRSLVLNIKDENYIKAARICGAKNHHIIFKYIIPNISSPIMITSVLDISTIILSMSGLSFLGLGAQRPAAEWGAIISEGRSYLQVAPWITIFTGIAIFIVVIAFNILGNNIQIYLDKTVSKNC